MTTDNIPEPNVLTFEAPASWNTRYLDPEGFECQLTLRGETGLQLLERVQGAITYLLKIGCKPITNGKYSAHTTPGNGNQPLVHSDTSDNGDNGNDRSFCPIHQCNMTRWEKNGRVWYSHKVGEDWCTGKVKTR